jgi:tetratricopeptide (TPR) repeat protein
MRADWPALLSAVILATGTLAIYCRTLSVPLLLDDIGSIGDNLSIRSLWPPWPALSPPAGAGVVGRPLLNLTYAVNYAAGGASVAGYHIVNILIHVLAAWTLFALLRRTLRSPVMAGRFGPASTVLALAASAIWAWHPVQTESVTYLSQRAESLMGLFYLLTLYFFARGAQTGEEGGGLVWYSFSILACVAGTATKEVIVTAPLLVFLYDRTFIAGSFAGAWRRHWPIHSALAASLFLLGWLMIGIQSRGVGFSWAYGVVECRVVVKYLLLSFWPHPLVFDYGKFAAASLSQVWPFALVLASLLSLALFALRRCPPLGFAACWFFLILAPTSSILSILESPMAENRLYLPLAAVASLVVLGAFALAGRRCLAVLGLAAAGLALAAAHRNQVYSSDRALWADTVAKVPSNVRALNNLACIVLVSENRTQDAIAGFEEALRLRPDFTEAHNNLARALTNVPGRLNEAIAQCEEALREYPDYAEAHCTLGFALAKVPGRLNDAIAQYREAIRLKPNLVEAHENLGNAWYSMPGRLDDAIGEYRAVLRLKPDSAEAHFNLGSAWSGQPGRQNDAIAEFEAALTLKADYAEARVNLGNLWMRVPERLNEAIAQYEAAVRLDPDVAELRSNLGYALSAAGRTREAIAQYELALRLKPDLPRVRESLARLRATQP